MACVLLNAMSLDFVQRATLGVAVVAFAYFVGHTIHKKKSSSKPEDMQHMQASGSPNNSPSRQIKIEAGGTYIERNEGAVAGPGGRAISNDTSSPNAPELDTEQQKSIARLTSPDAASIAAEHRARTSVELKKEEIRKGYEPLCDRVVARFNLHDWSPLNQVTRIVATNWGHTDAPQHDDGELAGTAWLSVRVMVAYETTGKKIMKNSYVLVGRTPSGNEIVALFSDSKDWSVLSARTRGLGATEELMVDTVKKELKKLAERLAPEIAQLP